MQSSQSSLTIACIQQAQEQPSVQNNMQQCMQQMQQQCMQQQCMQQQYVQREREYLSTDAIDFATAPLLQPRRVYTRFDERVDRFEKKAHNGCSICRCISDCCIICGQIVHLCN